MQAMGKLGELLLVDGQRAGRIICDARLIPPSGRYLLAHDGGVNSSLATPIFSTRVMGEGFITGPNIPESWLPGIKLFLRGPLGHGFNLPPGARKVALIAFNDSPGSLLSMTDTAIQQGASITLLCKNPPDELPLQIEVQPLSALEQVCNWADYVAISVNRDSLPDMMSRLAKNPSQKTLTGRGSYSSLRTQVLIQTAMSCGGLAECGVCTVETLHAPFLICEAGPVFDLDDLL